MNSIYFQVTSSGYHRSQKQAPINVDYSKQLPIYRTVNQFMNLPSHQKPIKDPKIQSKADTSVRQEKTIDAESQSYNKVKFVTFSSAKSQNLDEKSSSKTVDPHKQQIRIEKCLSVTKTSEKQSILSNDTGKTPTYKQYESDVKTERSTLNLQQSQRSNLYYQLQKEKALRQNLENSYNSLLQKLNHKKYNFTQDEQRWNFDQLKLNRSEKRHATQQAMTERLPKCGFQQFEESLNEQSYEHENKLRSLRNSCCNFKHSQDSQQLRDQQDYELEEDKLEIVSQRELLQDRVQEDMLLLKNRLLQMENKMLKIQLYEKNQECSVLEKEHSEYSFSPKIDKNEAQINIAKPSPKLHTKEAFPGKEHIHYLFTILVMFLCIAMMNKK